MTDMNPMSPMQQGLDMPDMRQAIVHVREDSNSDMERLFSVLQPPSHDSPTRETVPFGIRPWKDPLRKLPKNFFNPPQQDLRGHNRESSADAVSFGQSQPSQALHSRSHSSPAQLPHTLSIAQPAQQQQQQQQAQHPRQASLTGFNPSDNPAPLPAGWEMAKTADGQRYFMNHETKKTQWDDPRLHLPLGQQQKPPAQHQGPPPQLQQQQQAATTTTQQQQLPHMMAQTVPQQQQPSPQLPQLPVVSSAPPGMPTIPQQVVPQSPQDRILGPLPTGWDQAYTPNGEVYFINHNEKKTSWFDPRIPRDHQRPGMKLAELQNIQNTAIQVMQQQLVKHQQQQQAPLVISSPGTLQIPTSLALNTALSPNHSLQARQQQNQLRRTNSPQPQHQQLNLQDIQRRREELSRQQALLDQQAAELQLQQQQQQMIQGPASPPATSLPPNVVTSQTQPIMAVNTLDMQMAPGMLSMCDDPILGQAGNAGTVSHAKQNSADSGLGGMGTNYSLPRTPEDFLSNVEEMDAQDGGGHRLGTDLNMNDIPIPGQMDTTSIADSSEPMDGDDLMPSIQDENIASQVMENLLTWL